MYSWPLLVSMLTMMDLIDGSHSTRTPAGGRRLRSFLAREGMLTSYGSCWHGVELVSITGAVVFVLLR